MSKMVTVTNASATLVELPDGVRVAPGYFQVPEEIWASHKKNPAIQVWLRARILVEGKVQLSQEDPFERLAPEAIEALINAETDVDLLKAFSEDHREVVAKPAAVRLAALGGAKKRKGKKTETTEESGEGEQE